MKRIENAALSVTSTQSGKTETAAGSTSFSKGYSTTSEEACQDNFIPIGTNRAFDAGIAAKYGIDEAVVLGQIKYWVEYNEKNGVNYHDGHYWTFCTIDLWREQMPWYSIRTLNRIFSRLKEHGLILTGRYNKKGYDQTRWYTVNYDAFSADNSPLCQNGRMTVCQNGVMESDKVAEPIPTLTESATETGNSKTKVDSRSEIRRDASTPADLKKEYPSQEVDEAIQIVDNYINVTYHHLWGEHPTVSPDNYAIFARKLLQCQKELGVDMDELRKAITAAAMSEKKGDPTIMLVTSPHALGHWLVKTGAVIVAELHNTDYDFTERNYGG